MDSLKSDVLVKCKRNTTVSNHYREERKPQDRDKHGIIAVISIDLHVCELDLYTVLVEAHPGLFLTTATAGRCSCTMLNVRPTSKYTGESRSVFENGVMHRSLR